MENEEIQFWCKNTKKLSKIWIHIVGMGTSIFSETTSSTSENKTASFKLDDC